MDPKLQTCEKCMYFVPDRGADKAARGECHRHAPGGGPDAVAVWPKPLPTEGCGDGLPASKVK